MSWESAVSELGPLADRLRDGRRRLDELRVELESLNTRTDAQKRIDSTENPGLIFDNFVDLTRMLYILAELRDKCHEQTVAETFDYLEYLPDLKVSPGPEILSGCLAELESFLRSDLDYASAHLHQHAEINMKAIQDYPLLMWPARPPGNHVCEYDVRACCDAVTKLTAELAAVLGGFSLIINKERDEHTEWTADGAAHAADYFWTAEGLRAEADENGFLDLKIKGDQENGYKYDLEASKIAYDYLAQQEGGLKHLNQVLEWAASVNLSMKTQYHGTSRPFASQIVKEGFQDKGVRTGRAYGDGAYTTPRVESAAQYANQAGGILAADHEGSIVVSTYEGGKVLKYEMTDSGAEFYTSRKLGVNDNHPTGMTDDLAIAEYAKQSGYDAIYDKRLHYLITRNRANIKPWMRIDPSSPAHPHHTAWRRKIEETGTRIGASAAKANSLINQVSAQPAANKFGYRRQSTVPASSEDGITISNTSRGIPMHEEYRGEEHANVTAALAGALGAGANAGRYAVWYWDELTRDSLAVKSDDDRRLVGSDGNRVHGDFGFVEATDGKIHIFRQKEIRIFLPGSDQPEIEEFEDYEHLLRITRRLKGDWYIQGLNHSSPVAGRDVKFAGEVRVYDGVITNVTDRSGHYQPSAEQTYAWLASRPISTRDDTGMLAGAGLRGHTLVELIGKVKKDGTRLFPVTIRIDQLLGTGNYGRPDAPGMPASDVREFTGGDQRWIDKHNDLMKDLDDPVRRELAEEGAKITDRPVERVIAYHDDDGDPVYYSDDE